MALPTGPDEPSFVADARPRVEAALLDAVRTNDPFLTEVASHLIRAGGKRVRPLFAAGAGACTHDAAPVSDEVILGGVAVELVHLGSLYHDDVIDEATVRRTVTSVNARWGNLTAILAGDFLLAKASEIAASLGTEVAGLLAATIGRLCEGEVGELRSAYDIKRTEGAYLASIQGKTASLFATACRIGGIVGGLPREHVEALTAFGDGYGMAFQIVDDVLDLTATDEELGKPTGHDLVEGVYTLPVLLALRSGGSEELAAVLGRPLDDGQVAAALDRLRETSAVAESVAAAGGFVDAAVAALVPLGDAPGADWLAAAARSLVASFDSASAPA